MRARVSQNGGAISIYQRHSGIWHLDCMRDGERFRCSLRTTDRDLAELRAEETMEIARKERMRRAAGLTLHGLPIDALKLMIERMGNPVEDLVYVVYSSVHHRIKIGHSTNVRQRLADLQTSNPESLDLLLLLPGGRIREYELHERFKVKRRIGEWFDVDWDFIDWLERERQVEANVWAYRNGKTIPPSLLPQPVLEGS